MPPQMAAMQRPEQSSCTQDRIQHALERCLCGLGRDSSDQQLWSAGRGINRWCLEELVKRDAQNFLILLQQLLGKTEQVLLQCRYELVVPLTLLFSSTLLTTPYIPPDCGLLHSAYLLFHNFLSWPEPCSSASKHLLLAIQQELRAPGISFQRLVRSEQGLGSDVHPSKTMTVFLVSPDEDAPLDVQSVSEQLSSSPRPLRDVTIGLILHGFQAALGPTHSLRGLHSILQTKQTEELEQLLAAVTDSMEAAAAAASDLSTAREELVRSMESLAERLAVPRPGAGAVESITVPSPKCHLCSWDSDSLDVLSSIIASNPDQDSAPDCFPKAETNEDNVPSVSTAVGEAEAEGDKEDHRFSSASCSSRESVFSSISLSSGGCARCPSTLSASSGVDSDCSEDAPQEDTDDRPDMQDGQATQTRKKPKKKSRSLLNVERFSSLFRSPASPTVSRVKSIGLPDDLRREGPTCRRSKSMLGRACPANSPHVCIRRRPILSSGEADVLDRRVLVRVVVFGGDREVGRLARAYSRLQRTESRTRLTQSCKLQFYLMPTRGRLTRGPGGGNGPAEGQMESPSKATPAEEADGVDNTADIAQIVAMLDPWYEQNVLSLLSLSSDVLQQQSVGKEHADSDCGNSPECFPLLANLVLYYCRNASQPVLLQLYQAELTLVGGERIQEVFVHSLELGHTAGTRAVKAMGAASKRFGIDGEREAVPLTLSVAFNKVTVSGRSQWRQAEMVCTSVNLHKTCRNPNHSDSTVDGLKLMMAEVLKRQSSKSKKSYNQHISVSEVRVDAACVSGVDEGTTFAVCLDQDEKKIVQSVTRCEVSLCCKPGGNASNWRSHKASPGLVRPLRPSYRSLLCLPITSFTAS